MGRRRRKKRSMWVTVPMWLVALALVGWGVWQAVLFRRTVLADWEGREVTTQPVMAVGSETVSPQGAQGGEPWAMEAGKFGTAEGNGGADLVRAQPRGVTA